MPKYEKVPTAGYLIAQAKTEHKHGSNKRIDLLKMQPTNTCSNLFGGAKGSNNTCTTTSTLNTTILGCKETYLTMCKSSSDSSYLQRARGHGLNLLILCIICISVNKFTILFDGRK